MTSDYIESVKKQFEYYKMLGEKTFDQVSEDQLFWQYNAESNSIAIIVKHLCGNMLSRWTDFLTSDGEKEWRQRDAEFENDIKTISLSDYKNKYVVLFFYPLDFTFVCPTDDLTKIIYIRNQGHSVIEAINRQLAHYPYHIGQIVFIGKMMCDEKWNSLSIPKGNSTTYNSDKFSKPKEKIHFTEEFLGKKE